MFYSLHQRGEGVSRIHKQGLIKHDFQRPHSEKVRLRGQTDISQARMCRSELLADYYITHNICFILTSAEELVGRPRELRGDEWRSN